MIHGGGTVIGGVGKGVKTGGGFVVGGVGHVGGFAGRKIGLIKKKDKSGKEILVPADEDGNPIPGAAEVDGDGFDVPAGQVSQPANVENLGSGVPTGLAATTLPSDMGAGGPDEPGTLAVTVLSAKDLKGKEGSSVKPYVVLKLAGQTHKTDHVKGVEPEWCVSSPMRGLAGARLIRQERKLFIQHPTWSEFFRGDCLRYVSLFFDVDLPELIFRAPLFGQRYQAGRSRSRRELLLLRASFYGK